jgi:hypothetical protein
MAQSPCSFLPLAPFSTPLSLTWKPSLLWWGPVHSGPRLLINWALNRYLRWMGNGCAQSGGGANSCSSWVLRVHISTHQSLLYCTLNPAIHFNGSNVTAYNRASNGPKQYCTYSCHCSNMCDNQRWASAVLVFTSLLSPCWDIRIDCGSGVFLNCGYAVAFQS